MINGLLYISNWIDEDTEKKLLEKIETGVWENSLQRKVQQFGPKYNYTTRKLNSSEKEIPIWLKNSLFSGLSKFFSIEPQQIIVNQYLTGQGITKHVDASVFGPTIASLSLLSQADMMLGKYRGEEIPIKLERRSLLILTGEARTKWYHYVPPVKEKRISITFRTLA